jgi:RHS repeat-associated protein
MELRPSPKTTPVAAWGASFGRAATPQDFGIEWNAENQLTRVTRDSAEVARFAYDPLGRRVEKIAGASTTYSYAAEDIVREATGGVPVRYVHGPGIDEPLAVESSAGQLQYEHADGLGSELKRTDGSGATTLSRSYEAFGEPGAGAATSGISFTGREWDPETQLYYYRARYYDPKIGRFASEDPIGLRAGPNPYSYVGGNPTRFTDSEGLCRVEFAFQKGPFGNHHTVIIVTDPSGGENYHRGGPARPGPSGSSPRSANRSSGSTSASSGSNGFGPIETESGAYRPGTIDWGSAAAEQVLINNNDSCECINRCLEKAMKVIEQANIPYKPFGPNSNSAAYTAAAACGLPTPPPPVSVPGYDVPAR